MSHNEFTYVEQPLMQQLESQWREVLFQNDTEKNDPLHSWRDSFLEVVLWPNFLHSIKKINPWLTDQQAEQVLLDVRRIAHDNLFEANEKFHSLLLGSWENKIQLDDEETGEKNKAVKLIDFWTIENNQFLAINQFKVREKWVGKVSHIYPDIVLFINGLPIWVIECKSPTAGNDQSAVEEWINQLKRYSNNRGGDLDEGNESLFAYNQLMIVTCRQEARVWWLYAPKKFYLERKDSHPYDNDEKDTSQHRLVRWMLDKKNLLSIIQNFIIFTTNDEGKKIKILSRYQQFRAVTKMIERLSDPTATQEDKGGVVRHTQWSGKSLTMVFLVRALRNTEFWKEYKIVFLTDRRDLQRQIWDTAQSIGEYVYPKQASENTMDNIQQLLATDSSQIVNAMVHKFRNKDEEKIELPVLNKSKKIIMLIDEAHRSHASLLGANVMNSLPNAIRIAFTGTPIITGKKRKKTHEIFGEYIDTYTIEQAVKDGATVQIYYEPRTSQDEITNKDAMDQRFADVFSDKTEEEKNEIVKKYWSKKAYLESPDIIQQKAQDMVKHYLQNWVFVNWFKAQVVASSKEAVVMYKKFLDEAISDQLEALKDGSSPLENADKIDVAVLERLKTAAIISHEHNQSKDLDEYTKDSTQRQQIKDFKKPFVHEDETKQSGLWFLIVTAMLLTWFDAPIEQVMYLDKKLIEHNLLQAIARVNRTYSKKSCGYIIDYYGVGNHLQEALEIFSQDDIAGALLDVRDELPKLDMHHQRLVDFWNRNWIHNWESDMDIDDCVALLKDENLRAEFVVAYKMMSASMDIIFPNKWALKYADDYKTFGFIMVVARNRYRDNQLDISDAWPKMKEILNEFLTSKWIDASMWPVAILDAQFDEFIQWQTSNKSKASEMEHAIRHHISEYYNKDPEYYKKLSEKLEEVIEANKGNWDLIMQWLDKLLDDAKNWRTNDEENTWLDLKVEIPFYDIIKVELADTGLGQETLIQITIDLVEEMQKHIYKVWFWKKNWAQKAMMSELSYILSSKYNVTMNQWMWVLNRVVELAKNLWDTLIA